MEPFEHLLYVLPPVADRDQILWFGYLDHPDGWRLARPTPAQLLEAAAALAPKVLAYERNPSAFHRHPNFTSGTVRPLPNLPPRWVVKITVDTSEDAAEWSIEVLDDSAWGASGYDLKALFRRLASRLQHAEVPIQPLLGVLPTPTPAALRPESHASVSEFEQATLERIEALDAQIAVRRSEANEVAERLHMAEVERRALLAAIQAYRKNLATAHKPPRTKPTVAERLKLEASA
jgi:hypothetical protein